MFVLCEYSLRDLRGDDPDEHDGDNQAQPRPVLEAGTHVRRRRVKYGEMAGAGRFKTARYLTCPPSGVMLAAREPRRLGIRLSSLLTERAGRGKGEPEGRGRAAVLPGAGEACAGWGVG